jgi:hypothetical protein
MTRATNYVRSLAMPQNSRLRPIAGDRPNRDNLRVVPYRLPILSAVFLFLLAAPIFAQVPRAIVTGPKESRCGSLVILDASESVGSSRLWLLAVSPEETSFLPVESGLKCIFASPTPGTYRFVLVVAGTNANGGAVADMTTHAVTLRGADGPPPPIDPPVVPPTDPTDPPTLKKAVSAVYFYEKDLTAPPKPVLSALQQINANGSGIVATALDDDVENGPGETPAQYAKALEIARKAGLPCLVVTFSDGTLRTVQNPKTEIDVTEAVK